MAPGATAVALVVRGHPRGGPPSGRDEIVARLRRAASELGETNPELLSGPSSLTPGGALVLPLSTPDAILEAVLFVADSTRPLPTTFAAAVCGTTVHGRDSDGSPAELHGSMMAAEAATSIALAAAEETDPRSGRVAVQLPEHDALLAPMIELVLLAYDRMTERQRQMVNLARRSDTQQRVATHLNISRQAVNQSLAAAGWRQIHRAEEAVRARLGSRESP
jgi:hypothetical protein